MARKNGLNRKEQILCAKWLTEKVPVEDIAKKLKTSETIVKRFTQDKLDAAAKRAKARLTDQSKQAEETRKKAALLKATMDDSDTFA